ncbi:MAG TPA: PAS domain S-box protein, partial [Polyangiaceae bacterium]|nr:PAS domain S-box protein [Polyangiaceae bacterium]
MDHVQEPTWREDMLLFTQFAVDNLSDAAYWIKQDASIIYVNTAACQMLGYTGEELLAKRIYELNPDITEHDWSEVWNRLRDAGRRTFEGRHITKDGRLIPIEICANFLKFNGQEYSCAFTRDITERKRLQQRLSQAEKMDAIGRLAGGVAHDFNNQLTGIIGCADLLEIECKDSVRSLQLVRTIHQLAERASDLTSQLLAFARKGKYRTEPVDVHTLLAEVEGILLRSVDKKITIETRALAATAMVLGDPSQLQNTILNLALNARDAMPTGGTLTLATENISVDQKFCSNQAFPITPGNYVLLRVQDTGQGMATDVLK